jgi:hypothetical protein
MAINIPPTPIQDIDFSSSWRVWLVKVRDLLTGISTLSWSVIDFTNSNITDIVTRNHNDLQTKQGGTTNEYYHLTSSQHTDLTAGGNTTLHKHLDSYGEMYTSNTSTSVTVSVANTAYEISSGLSSGELSSDISFGSNHYLLLSSSGKYHITWSMSIDTTVIGDEIEGGIMLNGTASEKGTSHTTVGISGDATNIAGSLILSCSSNDEISLYVRNHSAARNVTVEHASVTIRKLIT